METLDGNSSQPEYGNATLVAVWSPRLVLFAHCRTTVVPLCKVPIRGEEMDEFCKTVNPASAATIHKYLHKTFMEAMLGLKLRPTILDCRN